MFKNLIEVTTGWVNVRLQFGKRGNQAVFLDLEAIPRRVILKNRGPETEEKTFNRDGLIKETSTWCWN